MKNNINNNRFYYKLSQVKIKAKYIYDKQKSKVNLE